MEALKRTQEMHVDEFSRVITVPTLLVFHSSGEGVWSSSSFCSSWQVELFSLLALLNCF